MSETGIAIYNFHVLNVFFVNFNKFVRDLMEHMEPKNTYIC